MTGSRDLLLGELLPITKQTFLFWSVLLCESKYVCRIVVSCTLLYHAPSRQKPWKAFIIKMKSLSLPYRMNKSPLSALQNHPESICRYKWDTYSHSHKYVLIPAPVSSGTQQVWKCQAEWNLFWAETPGGSCEHTENNGGGSSLQWEDQEEAWSYKNMHTFEYSAVLNYTMF